MGLDRSGIIGIGQRIALPLIHQDKRVEHHGLTGRIHSLDGLDHRRIRWRSPIDRAVIHHGDLLCFRTVQIGHKPRHVLRLDILSFDLGL